MADRYLLTETAQQKIETYMDDKPFETDDENEAFVFGLCTAFNALNLVPAADVRENVRGKWLPRERETGYQYKERFVVCNKCGGELPFARNFCPDCGSDMRGDPKCAT